MEFKEGFAIRLAVGILMVVFILLMFHLHSVGRKYEDVVWHNQELLVQIEELQLEKQEEGNIEKIIESELIVAPPPDNFEVKDVEVTAYAPMCPDAIEGWDYSGDPSVTASGSEVVVDMTAAGGPNVPFGTLVYIQGIGWRVITDRGGAIGDNNIDIAVSTKSEAKTFGRQNLKAIFFYD